MAANGSTFSSDEISFTVKNVAEKCSIQAALSIYQLNTNFSHPLPWRFRKRMKISGWPRNAAQETSCMQIFCTHVGIYLRDLVAFTI